MALGSGRGQRSLSAGIRSRWGLGWSAFRSARMRGLYERGAAVRGSVHSVEYLNSPHQVQLAGARVHYGFELGEETHKGVCTFRQLDSLERLSPGAPIMVFYDPERPSRNVAIPPEHLPEAGLEG